VKKDANMPGDGEFDGPHGSGGEVRRGKLSGIPVWSPGWI